MTDRSREDEMPISPKPDSPVPEIFSSKKIFFLNSSYSESRRSEIPHIESDYCPRDEVSRRLFQHDGDYCDCDCSSDGCWGCLRRNKQCFFKFFVLALSIALFLLLFGSLSYNLTRNKAANASHELDDTEWVSHYHEYTAPEENDFSKTNDSISIEPVLDLPVPVYEHSEDYDSGEDLRMLQYHLDESAGPIEPIASAPQRVDSGDAILIIYDGREPPRVKRSAAHGSQTREFRKPKRDSYGESLFERLNAVEDGMEKFWELYFKKGKTVFEPFSLTTPWQSTPLQSDEYWADDDLEGDLKSKFLDPADHQNFDAAAGQTETASEGGSEDLEEPTVGTSTPRGIIATENFEYTEVVSPESDSDSLDRSSEEEDYALRSDYVVFTEGSESVDEAATEAVPVEKEASAPKDAPSGYLDAHQVQEKKFRTWPFFHLPSPFAGLFGSSQQDEISVEPPPSDTVKGISLADAKKLKKERRKHGLLNSRVVGGSSDVRLPTAPDVSKPFVNAFETLKTNQQLSFTPSAASQFVLPYQMCLFATSFPGPRPSPHAPQPRTFSFASSPFFPPPFDKSFPPKPPQQPPAQQNFLSFSINNYPNALPPRQPTQPSAASVLNFPPPPFSQFPGPSKQPIFCTYLQPPLFQFPTVPGTADFSHAKCVDCQDDSRKQPSLAEELAFPSGREILCSDDKVSCVDGSGCVPVGNWCDNRVHCRDASDEAFCSCRERVAKDRICDGYVDCPHGEDETGCFDCPKTAFGCDGVISPESCIPLSKRCDGVRDCATGADEADCSAIFFHVRQNDSYHVSQVTGFLHRNWRGDWFPVCVEIGGNIWAEEACQAESGASSSRVEVRFAPVPRLYKGPFIVREEDGTAALQDHCKGHMSTFVRCAPVSCGTRIEHLALREIENRHSRDEVEKGAEEGKIGEVARDPRQKREETGRVVGGRESEPRAWPWAVAVYKNGAFHCGGVILDENWVLTAAHCMEQYWKNYYEVRGGMLRRFSFSAMEQARTISHVVIHENYDLAIMSNDLALLRLEKPFHFNRWVRPACLPVLADGTSKFISAPAPGTRCTAVGWGALKERGTDPDQLREVEIPIMVRCKHKEDLIGEEICAGRTEGGKDTCQGDSGGPLLCRDSGSPASWYVAGIVSHGEGCARPGEPGAYTRISLFVDWITANANDFRLPSVKPLGDCPGFRCHSGTRLCIPPKWVCNGYADCLEAEDEKNCSSESSASSILNHPYSGGYKYLEEEAAEKQKLEKNPSTQKPSLTELAFNASGNAEEQTEEEKFAKRKQEKTVNGKTEGLINSEEMERTTEGLHETVSLRSYATADRVNANPPTGSPQSRQDTESFMRGISNASTPTIAATEGVEGFQREKDHEQKKMNDGQNEEKQEELKVNKNGGGIQNAVKVIVNEETESRRPVKENEGKYEKKLTVDEEMNVEEEDSGKEGKNTSEETEEENEGTLDGTDAETSEISKVFVAHTVEEVTRKISDNGNSKKEVSFKSTDPNKSAESGESTESEELVTEAGAARFSEATEAALTSKTREAPEATRTSEGIEAVGASETTTATGTVETFEVFGILATPKATRTSEGTEAVGTSETTEAKGSIETPEVIGVSGTPEATRASKAPEVIRASEGTKATGTAETFEDIGMEGTPHTTGASIATKALVMSDTPEATGTSETTETTKAPDTEETESLENRETVLTEYSPSSSGFYSETAFSFIDAATEASGRRSEDDDLEDSEYFQCRLIVQSILRRYHCDGFEDCEDGTDEENCSCRRVLLASNPKLICDGRSDCPDGSDEKECTKCPKGDFLCKASDRCIPLWVRCDGVLDCEFGEDEAKCLALVGGDDARLPADGEPSLETEGLLIVNRNGVWTSKCQEESSTFSAGEAIEVCSSMGTIGYDRYENRSVAFNCTGLHVTCANALESSLDAYRKLDGNLLWPWNAVVYADGRRVCSAALLRSSWLLSSSRCLRGLSLEQNYVAAKLGAGNLFPEAEAVTVRVDGVREIRDSDVILLHLSEEVRQTESVRFLGTPYAFNSDPQRDSCVALGDRTLFLKISVECPETFRCFRKLGATPTNCRSEPWIGVVVCQSRFGWYPASVFSESSGHCGFQHSNFTDLQEVQKSLLRALDEEVEIFPEPACDGFRCPRGFCIPRGRICNGWPDCTSGEDESYELCKANKEVKECRTTDLKCRNGRCIPKVFFGDGKNDCGDESDEPRNKTCVEYLRLTNPKRICDGRRNCYDKTDEDYKSCPCDGDKFQCNLSGYCIPKDFVCDNEKDCPGGEDEEGCMGRKNLKNHAKTHLEIMQKSYGVWHAVCSGPMSKERSDSLCRDLGFEGALFSFERNQTVVVPEIDAFSWVKLNQKTSVALRGNRPFVRLVTANRTCSSVRCA